MKYETRLRRYESRLPPKPSGRLYAFYFEGRPVCIFGAGLCWQEGDGPIPEAFLAQERARARPVLERDDRDRPAESLAPSQV